ncbi:MAG: glycosyltransferase family 39 protein [Gemmatimonadales bacterium]
MLAVAAALRLLAAVFSGGFLASDDHHVVVAAADQIANGAGLAVTYARSALFPGIIGAIMAGTRGIGIDDPGIEMLIVRLLQAAYSLLVVYFVYRILERALGRQSAVIGGMLAAAFFALPVTAVHQLEESACQVPLLAACWWWRRAEDRDAPPALWAGLAGAALGGALILRFPLIGFVAVFAALALLRPRPVAMADKAALFVGLAVVIVLQGYSNSVVNHEWWYSFIQRLGPMLHPGRMAVEAEGYPHSPPWHYLLTLLAVLIPPVSVLFLAAAVKGAKQLSMLGIATLAFLVSHSLIANKQERFMLPILPVLFILIVAGLPWLAARMAPAYRGMWWYFWIVNGALLLVVTFSAAKQDRVDPLLFIYRRHDATGVLVAQYNQTFHVPDYYLGRPKPPVMVFEGRGEAQRTTRWAQDSGSVINYVILYSDAIETDRAFLATALHRNLTLVTVIQPSLADRLAHAINPRHNKARTAIVYTTS